MTTQRSRRSAVVAATVLASVTLLLFSVLQYQGPESVVYRLVSQIHQRNAAGVAPLLVEPLGSPYADANIRLVSSILAGRGRMVVVDARQTRTRAEVRTVFRFPSGQTAGLVWYLRKDQQRWRVDSTTTMNALRMP